MKSINTLITRIFLLVGFVSLNAQEFIPTSPKDLKKGIYKNFEEFKNNTPSITLDYEVLRVYKDTGGILDKEETAFFQLDVTKEEGKRIGRVYGFCDGKNVYINELKPRLKRKVLFLKANFIGPYCVFEYRPIENLDALHRINSSINMNTGRVVGVTKKELKKIITQENNAISYRSNTVTKYQEASGIKVK